ncbi:putative DNA-damage-repair/toleration protein [Babesia sp. Xinjiang]|uniref:putative DNA-damage-repair/toleration protein n=1 Tax=Babesia sp. Xinjiang TaxID=462227 RepID=UPI000A2546A5|nr:putative DNA-damage-repair/toleration protein [Babesia sp. Xinjiang]ORM39331.1 putative DNA-damage-repair/toleration protein [Babesia sp. Xinjiang]
MLDSRWASNGGRVSSAAVGAPAASGRQRRGQVMLNPDDVYDPMYPNDYERLLREQAQRVMQPASRVQLKFANVELEKLSAEEAYQRRMRLLEEQERKSSAGSATPAQEDGPKDIGMRIMQKLGWTEGKGLGANEQGIVAPLIAKNVGKNVGVIVQASSPLANRTMKGVGGQRPVGSGGGAQASATDAATESSSGTPATRILKLSFCHCVKSSEALQEEVEESLCQFGSMVNVIVLSGGNEEFTVYCEYEDTCQADRADKGLHKALPGYTVSSSFISEEEYSSI